MRNRKAQSVIALIARLVRVEAHLATPRLALKMQERANVPRICSLEKYGDSNTTTSNQQLIQVARLERLDALRGWVTGLGSVALVFMSGVAGLAGGNSRFWPSLFAAMSAGGRHCWLMVPLAIAEVPLLALATGPHVAVRKSRRKF